MQNSHELAPFLDELAEAASTAIMPFFRAEPAIENKLTAGFDPVTEADKAGERAMRTLINARHPQHGILGEEYGSENLEAEHVWVLDPIDGTRAFITGLPTWGTLIGLRSNGIPSLGMMVQPYVNERYAGDGNTAWYEGPIGRKQLASRACGSIADAVIFTTTPALFSPGEREVFDSIETEAKLVRYGTDCYGYSMVAAGLGDAVIESGLQPYDIVALVPIVEGAGGIVSNWTGGSPADGGQILASGDARLHDALLARLNTVAV
ncbi:histidinol-phosphatase [Roseibium aquae]|uniref:Histidinol-phosphatase n=1 Tax=Roseibium aquae TaxID=1323746 RepID=A0A916WV18_9HYPH|nr:histidinol-phosphatase [Roseibium aquae]GGB32320.1 histidinol-phosphatase [Roseibium aquae]